MTRTDNSLKNIKYNYLFHILSLLGAFLSRRVFTLFLTKEYLGLDGTFSSILSMLSLAELGIGTAITYSLYKPLGEGDRKQSAALMRLYKKAYTVIGLTVVVLGFAVTPFLNLIIKDMPAIPHIRLIYMLFVADSALSYFFVYKQSLISADQKQRVVNGYRECGKIILYVLQIIALYLTRNYFVYLGLKILSTFCVNLFLSRKADSLYPWLKSAEPEPLSKETKREIIKNTGAMMAHKIGGVVVSGTDNLLISYFVGIIEVGIYSNYRLLTAGITSIISTLFTSVTASVGNLGAMETDNSHKLEVFYHFNFLGGCLYGLCAVCLFVLLNPFITLWVGKDYLFTQELAGIIALNFYLTGMREACLTFRSAFGLYWYDRYKPLAESAINLVASILLAKKIGLSGILIGTSISTLTTCFWVEPYVLFKYGFNAPCGKYFVCYGKNTLVTLLTGFLMWHLCKLLPTGGIAAFALKAIVCASGTALCFLLAYCRSGELKYFFRFALGLLRRKTGRRA